MKRKIQVREIMLDVKNWLWIKDLQSHGFNDSQIYRKTGFDRKTIRKYVNSTSEPEPKKRTKKESKLDSYRRHIDKRVREGYLPASSICREIQEMGFTGKYTIVREYIRETKLPQEIPAIQFRSR
ncbi:MAG: transposase [Desulfobacterium sp.]|nr:transposase [Desulfobacterium sp.]